VKAALVAVCAASVLAASACGGKPADAGSAAELAPRSTYALLSGALTPQLRSGLAFVPQAPRLEALAARAQALSGSRGEVQIAVLNARGSQAVAFARPPDPKQFDRALAAAGIAHARLRGWTVFSRRRVALGAVERAKEHLADTAWYRASAPLHGDVAFRLRRLTVTADAQGDHAVARRVTPGHGMDGAQPLAASIPDDAVAAAAFHDGRSVLRALPFAAQLRRAVGVRAADLARAAPGDGALFARPGQPVPSLTLLAAGTNRAAAARLVSELDPDAPPPVAATVDGVPLQRVALGAVDLFYGTFERRLVLTDDPQAKLRSHFSALDPPGLPASTSRWAYLDAVDGLPALQSLAALGGTRLSPGFVRKLTPLRSVLAYVTHAGSTETLTVDVRQLP
jgi:hypothetical protein